MKPLTLKTICEVVKGKFISNAIDENVEVNLISTDTRNIEKGSLFVSIKGENFDGHNFIESALEKGAVCCLSEVEIVTRGNVILVESTRKALWDLAMYYISLFDVKVIGVTGSVGKTTTKDMIASVLSQKFCVHKTKGNFNNDIGLPKTIFEIEDKHEIVVLEMGMNHFGEISLLSQIAKPDVAVITNIGVAHIENLGSREGILQAKTEIFDFLKKDGICVLNGDDDMLASLKNNLKHEALWCGIENKDGYFAENIVEKGVLGISGTLCSKNKKIDCKLNVPGKHMILNGLIAFAIGDYFGLSNNEIRKGIETLELTSMRMDIIKAEDNFIIINDVYNASPTSMKATIDVLCSEKGRKIAILGDMLELGELSKKYHYEIGEYLALKKVDISVCIGENSFNTHKGVVDNGGISIYFGSKEDFLASGGISQIKKGDTVCLVKASRGMHFEQIVEKLQEVK